MINIEHALSAYPESPIAKLPQAVRPSLLRILRFLVRETTINDFIAAHPELTGIDFIEAALDHLGVTYTHSDKDREKIPSHGRVVIVANHPLGGIDALALIKLVSEVRKDIKIVANSLLEQIDPIRSLLIPLDTFGKKNPKDSLTSIAKALASEQALIIFPAGEVSRAGLWGVKDGKWHKGFLRFAAQAQAPILPVLIDARNSWMFYAASSLWRPLSTLMLPSELFRPRRTPIRFFVSEPIPYKSYNIDLVEPLKLKLFKKHLYRLKKKGETIFGTERCVAAPENRKEIIDELFAGDLMGQTHDGKSIYLVSFPRHTPLLKEIGRLREYTFRKVGEGSGKRRDIDPYDLYYRHIILWDPCDLEIVGSYRIGIGREIMDQFGPEGFYTHTLFSFTPLFENKLSQAIELGRSFVQPRYWGSRALDYLWQGIGAYLAKNPHITMMFGPVSISETYPEPIRELIAAYYLRYHGADSALARPRTPMTMRRALSDDYEQILCDDPQEGFIRLKEYLKCFNLTVPTLYKQYTDLCRPGGAQFHAFNIDPMFGNCIDGFITVSVPSVLPAKRARYIDRHILAGEATKGEKTASCVTTA